ncbi:MAG: hypothetical protein RSA49_02255 [Anaerovoracaceae bacterium]
MNILLLNSAGIDANEGLRRFGDKEELYVKYLRRFIEDESFIKLKKAMDEEAYKDAMVYSHTLKGISGNLSINDFYKEVNILVEAIRNNQGVERIKEAYSSVEIQYNRSVQAIVEAI